MDRLEKMDCRVSDSFVFGGLMYKTYERVENLNFNCFQGKILVEATIRLW
jgi:hypothetical protein